MKSFVFRAFCNTGLDLKACAFILQGHAERICVKLLFFSTTEADFVLSS